MILLKHITLIIFVLTVFLDICVWSLDDGLALTPPMGWRSWNSYSCDVNQTIMERIMDLMTEVHSFGAEKNESLFKLGYKDVGLDDCWQECGSGYNGSFHTKEGDPIINTTRFPNLSGMVKYGHDKNLTSCLFPFFEFYRFTAYNIR